VSRCAFGVLNAKRMSLDPQKTLELHVPVIKIENPADTTKSVESPAKGSGCSSPGFQTKQNTFCEHVLLLVFAYLKIVNNIYFIILLFGVDISAFHQKNLTSRKFVQSFALKSRFVFEKLSDLLSLFIILFCCHRL
jgi:hypothetical protein